MNIKQALQLRGFAEILVKDRSGQVLDKLYGGNVVTDLARKSQLKAWSGISGVINFPYLGVGSGSTAAAATDTALQTELTAGPGGVRYTCTDSAGGSLDASDIVSDTSVSPYRWALIMQGIMDFLDGNNGSNVRELALFTGSTFGAGTMGNRIVLGSNIPKTSAIQLVINIVMRM